MLKVWTREEANAFLKVARGNRYFIAFALALQTGIRWGEILALKWSDIDLDEGVLHVNCTDSFGHIVELVSGRRTVPLTSSLNEVLR